MITNLTQHQPTPDQIDVGVSPTVDGVSALLTFDTIPTAKDVWARAVKLADIAVAQGNDTAMIGGAPYLMGPLEASLLVRGITPVYAFSVRTSVDQPQPDGTTRKVAVFKHAGFVPAVLPGDQ